MNDFIKIKAEIWNQRLKDLMTQNHLSQAALAEKLSDKYADGESFTQKDVSRWINVGRKSRKSDIGFPKFSTMIMLADFFKVDVGYLTGETDYATFNMEALSKGTGLSSGALNNLIHPNGHYFPADMYADWWSMFFEDDLFFLLPEHWHNMCHAKASIARGEVYLDTMKDVRPVIHGMQDLANIVSKKQRVDEKNRCEDKIDVFERHYWSDLYELQTKITNFYDETIKAEVAQPYLNYEKRFAAYLRKQKLEQLDLYISSVNEKLFEVFGSDMRIDSGPLMYVLDILLQCNRAPDPELEFVKQYHALIPLLTSCIHYNHSNEEIVSIISEWLKFFNSPPQELSDSVKMLRGDTDVSNFTDLAESIGKVFTYISKDFGIQI